MGEKPIFTPEQLSYNLEKALNAHISVSVVGGTNGPIRFHNMASYFHFKKNGE